METEDADNIFDNEKSFFSEKNEIIGLIRNVIDNDGTARGKSPLELISIVLDKYQEQAYLITPHLPALMEHINTFLVSSVSESSDSVAEGSPTFVTISKIVYTISKVVGYKTAAKHLPHEVLLLRPVLRILSLHDASELRVACWESTYMLLLWLNTLSLIPFDLSSLESQYEAPLSNTFLITVREHLRDTGPTRDLAAYCIATFLVRTDMARQSLSEFLDWSIASLSSFNTQTVDNFSYFQRLGVLSAVTQLLKRGDREKLQSFVPPLLESVSSLLNIEEQEGDESKNVVFSSRSLERKLLCKLCQRAGLVLLPPREASWRYARGLRTLLPTTALTIPNNDVESAKQNHKENEDDDNIHVPDEVETIVGCLLRYLEDDDTVVRWSAAKGLGRVSMRVSRLFGQDILAAVLQLFDDSNSDEKEEQQEESAWHGGCLCLAELCRRGLVLPSSLPQVVPVLYRALVFDSSRRQQSIGASVRDAACYVCWAFARAYPPSDMQLFTVQLRQALLITTLFDREINCRRAAAAALQEMVGRQGHSSVSHGIDIISLADYVSIGQRKQAYLEIAPAIATFDVAFQLDFVKYLTETNLGHWDAEIRELSAKSLALILRRCRETVEVSHISRVLKELLEQVFSSSDVHRKHGSLLGVAQVLLVCRDSPLSKDDTDWQEMLKEISSLPHQIEKKRLFRGRGSELLREAVCKVCEAVACVALPLPVKTQVAFTELLNENLRQPHNAVQTAAQQALRVLLSHYSFGAAFDAPPSERLLQLTSKKYMEGLTKEENVAVTRGYAMALGALSPRLVAPLLFDYRKESDISVGSNEGILSLLERFSSPEKRIAGEYDAETCRHALQSAIELTEKLLPYFYLQHDNRGCLELLERMQMMVNRSGQDYNVDKRGDIGSWSRMAALQGGFRLLQAVYLCRNDEIMSKFVFTSYGMGIISDMSAISTVDEDIISLKVHYDYQTTGWQTAKRLSWLTETEKLSFEEYSSVSMKVFLRRDAMIRPNVSLSYENFTNDSVNSILTSNVSLCLQHLSEKLDTVRSVAGNVLCALLAMNDIIKAQNKENYVSAENQVFELLRSYLHELLVKEKRDFSDPGAHGSVHWSRPEHAFPFVLQVFVRCASHRDTVLTGLVTSVGSITESVSRVATQELLKHITTLRDSDMEKPLIQDFLSLITTLFDRMRRKDRIILPLLKLIDLSLKNDLFRCFSNDKDDMVLLGNWAESVAAHLTAECKACGNVSKLCAALDVQSLLLDLLKHDAVRFRGVVTSICSMLGHKYPRVRKYCAELVYLNVLSGKFDTLGISEEVKDALGERLTQLSWESDQIQQIIDGKRGVYEMLGLHYVAPKEAPKVTGRGKPVTDELDSYETLVKEAGY